jgi:hypothetical protein
MTTIGRVAVLGLMVTAAVCANGVASEKSPAPRTQAFLGACYCRAAGTLQCTGDLSEAECRQRCDEALCDDWFWKERLPCWNWGYGG